MSSVDNSTSPDPRHGLAQRLRRLARRPDLDLVPIDPRRGRGRFQSGMERGGNVVAHTHTGTTGGTSNGHTHGITDPGHFHGPSGLRLRTGFVVVL